MLGEYIMGLVKIPWNVGVGIVIGIKWLPRILLLIGGVVLALVIWIGAMAWTSTVVGNVRVIDTTTFFVGLGGGVAFAIWYYYTYAYLNRRSRWFRRWLSVDY